MGVFGSSFVSLSTLGYNDCDHEEIQYELDNTRGPRVESANNAGEESLHHTNTKKCLPVSYPALSKTTLAPPVLGLIDDGIPATTTRTPTDDPFIILLDQVSEEKFERCRNVRVVTCGLY